ncbi:MAG TPA: flagellar filament capping protein FliD [Burkholderiales bacterium]|nr:flagellar filament capping protein FliD [Burkholderiales bacterium]
MAVAPTLSNLGSSLTGTLSSPGIGSGLDVNSIVSALMQVEQIPLTSLNQKEASYQAELSAYGTVNSALSALQSSLTTLNTPSSFDVLSATVSDNTVLTASAASNAAAGSYNVQVSQLAQAQTLVAAGQANTTQSIGTGAPTTITFQFGTISGGTLANGTYSGATFSQDGTVASGTVTIDSSNNSLPGIRDAINAANIGVTASIVNDGGASPYRLVLQSSSTGAARSMSINVSGDATLAGLLSYNAGGTQNLTQATAAQNATLAVNGINLTSASNTVANAIQGVTFNLTKAGTSNVTVSQDSSGVQTAVQGFLKAYNDLQSTISQVSSYDATTKTAGPLLGDASLQGIEAQIRDLLGTPLAGSLGSFSSLAQLGIAFEQDGTMSLDSSKLSAALSKDPTSVQRIFSSLGTATDSLVGYVSSTANTQAGTYAVNVTALATQGTVTGSAPAGLTITAGVNDQLAVTLDGVTAGVTIAAGTYTATSLAAAVQAAINGASAFSSNGTGVTVTQSGGVLSIQSNSFGSTSKVSVSGTAVSNLLGSSLLTVSGTDVTGTINGVTAVGSGQFLTGATGDRSEGLQIQITGGSVGSRGTVVFSRGYAFQLDAALDKFLGSTGPLQASTDGINASIKDIDNQRTSLNDRLTLVQQNYLTQFNALDALVASMNSTSTFLTQQLALIPVPGKPTG